MGQLEEESERARGEGDDPEGRLARLERQGLLRRASAPLDPELLREWRSRARRVSGVLAALLAERREGR